MKLNFKRLIFVTLLTVGLQISVVKAADTPETATEKTDEISGNVENPNKTQPWGWDLEKAMTVEDRVWEHFQSLPEEEQKRLIELEKEADIKRKKHNKAIPVKSRKRYPDN